ncbi:MAG: hypothetical protein P4L55_18875 [Syntrophobacteraceae bacterium]|nr:hypothetical protein [Syntrophobacteraceae bacterium]
MSLSIRSSVLLVSIFCCCLWAWSVRAQGASQAEKTQFDTSRERIGPLRLGMAEKDVKGAVSCRPGKGREILEGATREYVQNWKYPKCGVILKMSSERKGGPKTVADITLTSPCDFKTGKGIHIGSTERQVREAYGRYRDPEASAAGQTFIAGSIFDGLMFTFRDGKVVEIFLGAAAE